MNGCRRHSVFRLTCDVSNSIFFNLFDKNNPFLIFTFIIGLPLLCFNHMLLMRHPIHGLFTQKKQK